MARGGRGDPRLDWTRTGQRGFGCIECFGIPATCDVTFQYVCSFGNVGGDVLFGPETNTLNLDPLFCNVLEDDHALCSNSACAIPTRPSAQIGAYDIGCGDCDSDVEGASWGVIKGIFH